MARIRTIKPDFFKHEELFDAEQESGMPLRVAFAGLWTQCDRDGRFEWRPRQLKTDILPYDEVDFSRVLDALVTRGFVVKYTVNGRDYGCVPSWGRHQVINNREAKSVIPQASDSKEEIDASTTRGPRVMETHMHYQEEGERKGKGREDSEPNGSGAVAPSAEIVSIAPDARKELFDDILPMLAKYIGRPVPSMRAQVAKWLHQSGDDARKIGQLIAEAVRDQRADPVSWIERCLKPSDPDALIYRNVL